MRSQRAGDFEGSCVDNLLENLRVSGVGIKC